MRVLKLILHKHELLSDFKIQHMLVLKQIIVHKMERNKKTSFTDSIIKTEMMRLYINPNFEKRPREFIKLMLILKFHLKSAASTF